MTDVFQVGNKVLRSNELMALLGRYQLLPQLLRGVILDEAIAPYELAQAEKNNLLQQFYAQNKLDTSEARETWLRDQVMTQDQLEAAICRPIQLEKFKQATWGHKLESYFMTRKPALDRVLYSLIRVKDQGLAQELYFRIKEGEQSFSELARDYSQGAEAATGGLVGPAPLTMPHPSIARTLAISQPGQLWTPARLEDWFIIVRLEKFYPAQLDDATRRQLIDELFELWLREQMQRTGVRPVESSVEPPDEGDTSLIAPNLAESNQVPAS